MAVEIPIPKDSYSEINITLSGFSYTLVFKENIRESFSTDTGSGRLYFDLYLEDDLIKSGIKIMENQSLLARYVLDDFLHGDIFCFRVGNDASPVVRNNVGIGKNYTLIYLTNTEIEEANS